MEAVALTYLTPDLKTIVEKLACQFNLPVVALDSKNYSYLLVLTASHLELRAIKKDYKPFYINFSSGKHIIRSQQQQKELLIKAVGIKSNMEPTIVDATAGLGSDSFLLAKSGCHVTMLERSSTLYLLLNDALQRLNLINPLLLKLIHVDSIDYLKQLSLNDYPDVIYLDPMFPTRTKSALVKKEMCMLHDLVGKDEDGETLFQLALNRAKKRVVVKRPRLAKPIADVKPSFVSMGRSTRFDVYLTLG